jgi:hypothetical protein
MGGGRCCWLTCWVGTTLDWTNCKRWVSAGWGRCAAPLAPRPHPNPTRERARGAASRQLVASQSTVQKHSGASSQLPPEGQWSELVHPRSSLRRDSGVSWYIRGLRAAVVVRTVAAGGALRERAAAVPVHLGARRDAYVPALRLHGGTGAAAPVPARAGGARRRAAPRVLHRARAHQPPRAACCMMRPTRLATQSGGGGPHPSSHPTIEYVIELYNTTVRSPRKPYQLSLL